MEDKIRDYIGHYFNDDELKIMKKNYIHNYTYYFYVMEKHFY